MKRTATILLLTLFCMSLPAHARYDFILGNLNTASGYIAPDIRWNQTIRNASGAASVHNPRNNVSLNSTTTKYSYDYDGSDTYESELAYYGLQAMKQIGNITTEFSAARYDDKDFESNITSLSAGLKASSDLALGLNLLRIGGDYGDSNFIALSVTKNLSEYLLIGGGYIAVLSNVDNLTSNTLYTGIGWHKKNKTSAEAVLFFTPENEDDNVDQSTMLNIKATQTFSILQLYGLASYRNSESDDDTNLELIFGTEFKLSSNFYLGVFGRKQNYEDGDDNYDSIENSVGLTARLIISKLQVEGSIEKEKEEDEDEDGDISDRENISLTATYLF